jgi:putative ATPase
VTSGVADIRTAIEAARRRLGETGQRTILFVDEIHRFSKSQQDALLHAVEDNLVILVGATTENPFFEVNAPLISRSRVIELTPLTDDDVREIVPDDRRRARFRWDSSNSNPRPKTRS